MGGAGAAGVSGVDTTFLIAVKCNLLIGSYLRKSLAVKLQQGFWIIRYV